MRGSAKVGEEERPNRESPVIDWCNQLAYARKKQRGLEGCVNPLIRLLWPIK